MSSNPSHSIAMPAPHFAVFLALPAELRLLIYSHIFLSDNFLSDYKSLCLTCQQVKTEVESEGLKYWKSWIKDAEKTWKDERICDVPASLDIPHTFQHVGKLVTHVPILILGLESDTLQHVAPKEGHPQWTQILYCKAAEEMLRPLLSLCLNTLNLRITHPPVFEGVLQTFRYESFFRYLLRVMVTMRIRSKERQYRINAERLLIDFGPEVEALDAMRLSDGLVWDHRWRFVDVQEIWVNSPTETDKTRRVAFDLQKGFKRNEGWVMANLGKRPCLKSGEVLGSGSQIVKGEDCISSHR